MSNWTLIYSTDSAGAVDFGSVPELRAAVFLGADVKIIYRTRSGTWWSRYCPSVSIQGPGGSSSMVSATYVEAADTTFGSKGLEFATPFAIEYHIYNSNGVRQVHKTGHDQPETSFVPMRWYVRDYEPQS